MCALAALAAAGMRLALPGNHLPCAAVCRFVLNRDHAELFAADTELDAMFEKDCWVKRDMKTWKWRDG